MALTWTGFDLTLTDTLTDVLTEFFVNQLQTLTHWQNKGGGAPGASVLFESGAGGGLLERVSDSKQFALLYRISGASDNWSFQAFAYNNRFVTNRFELTTNLLAGFMDETGSRWANKTEFFGPESISMLVINSSGVTGGPFERGETITIDAAGDNVTATVDEVIYDAQRVTLLISNCSGVPSSNWNSVTVTGGTSGASATTESSAQPAVHWHIGTTDTYDLRGGPDFPVATDVITGATSGVTATVSTADPLTGRITVTGATGRFQVNEQITWTGPSSTFVGWHAHSFDVIHSFTESISDFTVDNETCLIGEDADRLVLLIPDSSVNDYKMLMFGKWWDSDEGHGRMDGIFCGVGSNFFGGGSGGGGFGAFLDGNGETFVHRAGLNQNTWGISGMALSVAGITSQGSSQTQAFWANVNGSHEAIERPARAAFRTALPPSRMICTMPEVFTLPAEPWRTVGIPGSWTGNGPLALFLDDNSGRCIEFDNGTLTP